MFVSVGLSTDIICGFCGETDEEFEETMSLMELVDYNVAFLFPYSMREVSVGLITFYFILAYLSYDNCFFSFMLYTVHSKIGIRNLSNSGGIAC